MMLLLGFSTQEFFSLSECGYTWNLLPTMKQRSWNSMGTEARQDLPCHWFLTTVQRSVSHTLSALSLRIGLLSSHSSSGLQSGWDQLLCKAMGSRGLCLKPVAGSAMTRGRMSQQSGVGRWGILIPSIVIICVGIKRIWCHSKITFIYLICKVHPPPPNPVSVCWAQQQTWRLRLFIHGTCPKPFKCDGLDFPSLWNPIGLCHTNFHWHFTVVMWEEPD